VTGVDEPVEYRFGDDGVGEQRVPVGGSPVAGEDERAGSPLGDQLVEVVGLRGGELDDAENRVVRRTTSKPVRNIKADWPWTVPSVS
jgi:hypothetical protein